MSANPLGVALRKRRAGHHALAWARPAVVVIPGTTNPGNLRANIAAAEVPSQLTDAEVARLTSFADESTAVLGQPPRPRENLTDRVRISP